MKPQKTLVAIAFGVYLLGLGFLGGMAAERIRFDQRRTAVLDRYNDTIREWHQSRMLIERGKKPNEREHGQQLRRKRSSARSANWPRLIDESIRLKLKPIKPRPVKTSPATRVSGQVAR